MKQIGLILGGRSKSGDFYIWGDRLPEKHDIYLSYVLSVSAGTCNAIDYVSKQIGRPRKCMIPEGRNIPPINCQHILKKG